MAGRELAQMGYTNLKEFAGGKKEWSEAGLPRESGNGNSSRVA
jgi:rhodanese-related sulfurtransferase